MKSSDLIEVAFSLLVAYESSPSSEDPSDALLRRAVSTAYYALFHAICESSADLLVGSGSLDPRERDAWVRVYRSLNHNDAKRACGAIGQDPDRWSTDLADVAAEFVTLQIERNAADYDPLWTVSVAEANALVGRSLKAVNKLFGSEPTRRRAFCVSLLMKGR